MDPALLLFLVLLGWASKTAWQHVMQSYRADRDAKIAQAEGNAPPKGLSAVQRKRVAAHHASGWWAREVLGGFPVARTGWQSGWLAHKLAALQNRHARDQARALHRDLRNPVSPQQQASDPEPPEDPQPAVQNGTVVAGPWPRPLQAVPDPPEPSSGPAAPPASVPGPYANGSSTKPLPTTQGDAVPTGTVPESTYDQDQRKLTQLAGSLEAHIQELRVEVLQNQIEQTVSVLNDSETIAKLADAGDELRKELKAAHDALEAVLDAKSTLKRNHGAQNQAHQDAPIPLGADPHYYQ